MNCFVCGTKKEDFQVWTNKIVIGATYDSEFQNNDIIKKLPSDGVICHKCIENIEVIVDFNREIKSDSD